MKTLVCKIKSNIDSIDDFYVCGSPDDQSVIPMMSKGHYELHVQKLFNCIVKKSMTVLDVGANYGQHTAVLSKLVGDEGKVIAIEASEENVYYLKQTLEHNKCTNVTIIKQGVWSHKTELLFTHCTDGGGWDFFTNQNTSNNNERRVQKILDVSTLDIIIEDDIDFIKMDIEGSELFALKGAQKILKQQVPILIELNSYTCKKFMDSDIMDLVNYIISYGYKYIYGSIGSGRWVLMNVNNIDWLFKNGAIIIDALFSNKMIKLGGKK